MTNLIVSFSNFAKAPKKFYLIYAPKNNTFLLLRENSYLITIVRQS
jgi:hypothetical protein